MIFSGIIWALERGQEISGVQRNAVTWKPKTGTWYIWVGVKNSRSDTSNSKCIEQLVAVQSFVVLSLSRPSIAQSLGIIIVAGLAPPLRSRAP